MSGGVILVTGLLMTLVTQLELIKKLPYIVSNLLSLATVFPLAVSVIILIYVWRKLTKNFLFMMAKGSVRRNKVSAKAMEFLTPKRKEGSGHPIMCPMDI